MLIAIFGQILVRGIFAIISVVIIKRVFIYKIREFDFLIRMPESEIDRIFENRSSNRLRLNKILHINSKLD